jgi:opacity protein-like surface antigen
MRILVGPVLVLMAVPALAADAAAPKAELFGGYSYTKDGEESLHGGEASLALRLTRWIALEADVSAHYGSALGISTSRLFFLGGPRFAYRTGTLSVFTHYLAGGARSRAGITVVGVDITESRTDFAMAFGGGVDVGISDRWAVRAQADYVLIRADGGTDKEPRFSAGAVFVAKRSKARDEN